ncbi:MAG TPA: hemerythrin domain-containing protein [Bacteriovoracaceae bacterium]|nr:hemerythrin domain-containing protein [Bacteriovoracaceae bacterium]
MEDNILSKIKEEHRELQIMLLKVERCKDPQKKLEYYDEMKKVLIPHMEGEEQTLYAKIRSEIKDKEAIEMADDADYEHQEIKEMLAMLDETDIGKAEWNDLFKDLKESLQIHVDEEEELLFNEAKEDFSKDELEKFVYEFEEAKSHASYH